MRLDVTLSSVTFFIFYFWYIRLHFFCEDWKTLGRLINQWLQDAGVEEKSIYDFKTPESSTWEAAWLKQLRGITADQIVVVRTAVTAAAVDALLGSAWRGTELHRQHAAADVTYIFKINKYISIMYEHVMIQCCLLARWLMQSIQNLQATVGILILIIK